MQAFTRIENVAGRLPDLHPDDAWITSMFFHGGFPHAEPGSRRFLVSKSEDSSLFIDVLPRMQSEVLDAKRAEEASGAAVLLAVGALVLLAMARRAARPLMAIAALFVARVALLPAHAPTDPLHLLDFTLYGSKILGPFTKSPFDLLLTAAAFLGIVSFARPLLQRLPLPVRAIVALAAGWGYLRLIGNFVSNSRISAIPDHVMPASLVQGVLFAAVLLLGFAVVTIAGTVLARPRIDNSIVRVVVGGARRGRHRLSAAARLQPRQRAPLHRRNLRAAGGRRSGTAAHHDRVDAGQPLLPHRPGHAPPR